MKFYINGIFNDKLVNLTISTDYNSPVYKKILDILSLIAENLRAKIKSRELGKKIF